VVILLVALGAVAGLALTHLGTELYEARATLVLVPPDGANSGRHAATEAAVVQGRAVATRTLEILDGDLLLPDLAAGLHAYTWEGADVIMLEARFATAVEAQSVANATGQAYQELSAAAATASALADAEKLAAQADGLVAEVGVLLAGRPLNRLDPAARARVEGLGAHIAELSRRRAEAETEAALASSGVAHFQPASLPGQPRADAAAGTAIGAGTGVVLGLAAAVAFRRRRGKVIRRVVIEVQPPRA